MRYFKPFLIAGWLTASVAVAQEATPVSEQRPDTGSRPGGGSRQALIICGLTGDDEHHKLYAETVTKLSETLRRQYGFAEERIDVLFGDEPTNDDSEVIQEAERTTRENLERRTAQLRDRLQPADVFWVIVVGHSHYDGRHSWLNLPGPDIHQFDFAKLFQGIAPAEQVFLLTMPTSGIYIQPLSAKGRVIMTATLNDWETNETEFPQELARLLAAPPETKDFDVDEDGVITLYDLYVTVARNLAQSYLEQELLATEHPLIDDNGDGKGTEVQLDFLTPDQGGRPRSRKWTPPKLQPTADGHLSQSILLPLTRIVTEPETPSQ